MAQSGPGADRHSALVNGFQHELDLLQRHVRMIKYVDEHGPIGIIRLSSLLGVPKHKVRYSLRILEKEGYLTASPQGATTTDHAREFFDQLVSELSEVTRRVERLREDLRKNA